MPRGWFKSNTKIMPASATNGTINGAGTGVNASSPRRSNIATTGQRITPNNITGNASTNSRSRNSHPNATSTVGFGAGFGAGAVAPPGTIMPSVQSFSAGNASTNSQSRNSYPRVGTSTSRSSDLQNTIGAGAGAGAGMAAATQIPTDLTYWEYLGGQYRQLPVKSLQEITANQIANQIKAVLITKNTATINGLLTQLHKKLTPDLCEHVLSFLNNPELKKIAQNHSSYWRILAQGEISFRWSNVSQNSNSFLLGKKPKRFSPHQTSILAPDPQKYAPTFHTSYEKERYGKNTKSGKIIPPKWIYQFLDLAINRHKQQFIRNKIRCYSNRGQCEFLYERQQAIKHFVFRGTNELPVTVFKHGFQLGTKDNRAKTPPNPNIMNGRSSDYVTKSFFTDKHNERGVISTSYSYREAKMYVKSSGWIYICIPHRGFNLSSGDHLEIAELGIPNNLILGAIELEVHNHPHDDIINKIYLNKTHFYNRNFLIAFHEVTFIHLLDQGNEPDEILELI